MRSSRWLLSTDLLGDNRLYEEVHGARTSSASLNRCMNYYRAVRRILAPDSRAWGQKLNAASRVRDDALASLHALLLRAALFAIGQKRPALAHVRATTPV
jgi:hypothetical protein